MEDQHNVDTSCEISKDITFYCLVDHVVLGPFPVPQLKQRMELGMIDGMTYCWTQGMPQWSIIADIPILKDSLIQDEVVQENDIISSEALPSSISSTISNVEPKKRIPLENIPMELKFISPEGIGKIFDLVTHQWVDFATYIKLLDAETHDPSPKDSTVYVQEPLTVDLKTKKKRNCENRQKYRQRLRKRQEQGDWINAKSNPNVYVKGLPPDITEDQLNDIFKRAGVIKIDPETCRPKIRLYRDQQGSLNGDALVSFVHEDSVPIALKYLNGMEIKPNYTLQIEQAQFNLSRKSNHSVSSPKRPQQRKKYLAAKLQQQRLMTWDDSTTDGRIRIMILKPLWSFSEAKRYPLGDPFYKSIATQLNESLSAWIHIVSVTPIDRHPLGIVCVKFRTVELCEAAVARLNERPYHLLDLPNREVELTAQFFREKEPSLSQKCIESFHQQAPIHERFNNENLDLLNRLDIFLEAEKLCKSLKTSDEEHKEQHMSEDVNSCFSFADINAVEPSLLTQLNHQDFNWSVFENTNSSVPRHLVDRFQQWKRLAYFIFQYPLLIEAYIYDGKTNLKDQSLPSNTEDKKENEEDTKEQHSSRDEDENNLNGKPSTDQEKSWQDWLVGDDDDSDSSEFMIRTEQ